MAHAAWSGSTSSPNLVELATRRAAQAGLTTRISYQLVAPQRPLSFPDASFDAVFSKDAIIHVREKRALHGELLRVLRRVDGCSSSVWRQVSSRPPTLSTRRAWTRGTVEPDRRVTWPLRRWTVEPVEHRAHPRHAESGHGRGSPVGQLRR